MHIKDVFQWKQVSGQPLVVNELTVTPRSRALIVRFRGGGFVWQRPTHVLVEQNGQVKRLPIVDVTRMIQLALLAAGAGITLASWLASKKRKENNS
jgi:hypothetical protein